ncbi:MAG: threonylcarbamoyl-AMP synthase, partial [Alphaproteobacteria bacterium]|nr:threonylcarbamoyl-AMP synthase [Alphaproteobacteria bacterium]
MSACEAATARAAALLRDGGLVAFPTETVYGLGADATNPAAIARLYAAKGRPASNPLIVHVVDHQEAARLGVFDERADRLARRFWPGPLTLVVPRRAGSAIPLNVSADLPTIALRVPDHAIAQAILAATGRPIAAPSANRSGRVSPTDAAAVAQELGDRVDLIVDGGPAPVGIESTVVGLFDEQARLLRPGFVTVEAIAGEIGRLTEAKDKGPAHSPGQLASHYAPDRPLRLDAESALP